MSSLSNIKKIFFVFLSLTVLISVYSHAFGEPEYDAQGQLIPLGAEKSLGVIDQITPQDNGSGIILINDTPFSVTRETKYLTSYFSTSSINSFEVGQYVGFYRIKSLIIKMWPEENTEETLPKGKTPSPKSAPRDKGITKEKGVWKN